MESLKRVLLKGPVTCALVAATLVLNVSSQHDRYVYRGLTLHSVFSELMPWSFVTYALLAPYALVLLAPLYCAIWVVCGVAVESVVGSYEYAMGLFFSTLITGVLVVLVDRAVLDPVGSALGFRYQTIEVYPTLSIDLADTRTHAPHIYKERVHCLYYGPWPILEAVAFALCRLRGATAPVLPRWRAVRLSLQQLPLAIVGCAFVVDVLLWPSENELVHGWGTVVAVLSMFVAWLYERHTGGADLALDAYFYPASARERVRRGGEVVYRLLRPSKLHFLLPPRADGDGAARGMPMPVFASNAAKPAADGGTATLLPGTTAEEAERYRLIAREALARRMQESPAQPVAPVAERPVPPAAEVDDVTAEESHKAA